MPGIIVIGLQWGDEGKGKVVDLFSRSASHIVRSQGGCDDDHTVVHGGSKWQFRHVPSGLLHPHARCYIAGGCVVDPEILVSEMQQIETRGIDIARRFHLSAHAHLILPHHRLLDTLMERQEGSRGVASCIADRVQGIGLRVADLIRPDVLHDKLRQLIEKKNREIEMVYAAAPPPFEQVHAAYSPYGEVLRSFVSDVEGRLQHATICDDTILFEGVGGALLDPTLGTPPFAASSPALAGNICAGAGVGPSCIDEVIGVLKPYTTRSGEGPLPTLIEAECGEDFEAARALSDPGREQRIGWLDLVMARYAAASSGVGSLALTKLDLLDSFEEIKVCVGYRLEGEVIDRPPPLCEDLNRVEPVYEVFPGWRTPTKEVRRIRGLPSQARALIDRIEDACNTPISVVSVGPEREQTIEIDEEWL